MLAYIILDAKCMRVHVVLCRPSGPQGLAPQSSSTSQYSNTPPPHCLLHPSQSILTQILMFPLTRPKQSIASSKSNPDPAANAAPSPPPTTVPPPHALILVPASQEHQLTRMMSQWSPRKWLFRSRRRVGGGFLRQRRLLAVL